MSEAILKALMQLFALIVDIDKVQEISDKERSIIHSFLSRQLNQELIERYMDVFEDFLRMYHGDSIDKGSIRERKRTALTAVRILSICEKINEELEQSQKIYVIIQLIEYIAYGIEIREKELDFLQTVASAFNIPQKEYENILNFVMNSVKEIPLKENVLLINNREDAGIGRVNHVQNKNLSGEISFLNITSVNTFVFRYHGKEDLNLNGQHIQPGLTYAFMHGASIRGQAIDPIYYSDVAGTFSTLSIASKITFVARHVEYRFKNSENGLKEFNLKEESGRMVGIMGGSGVGKSTLLNVLNGNIKPQNGEILINGYNLYDEKEKETLAGVIGFVPQDDLLMEDLTVFQNLYFNARLCLNDYNDEKIREIVNHVLMDLDLYEIRDLKVGKPLSKVISGGQRKRVNIGLELLREPSVLFVDEPTSGLSSVDSEMVMNLLKEQVYKGKLVIVNIHQPSSDLYKMFDRIIFLDRGGYQIYSGNPSEAVVYFKTLSKHANAKEDQCVTCGNIDPDQVLQIIEAKIVNEQGKLSRTRKVSPREWFEYFTKNNHQNDIKRPEKSKLPENYYSIPGLLKQLKIFFIRDFLTKLTNRQSLMISLFEAPLLAAVLAFFPKYFSGTTDDPGAYVFRNNENLPAFLLISVVIFIFLGISLSSTEIIKDRKILKRESFLNLSRFSYLNSKILIMFMFSAIQAISYVLVGQLIFEIRGMTLSYWLILFTTACFANILGLNISSGLSTMSAIYLVVPFLVIPNILLSGVMVKFDKLHKSISNYEYVPIIGDMMTSRWAFEALAVEQFSNNRYEKPVFELNRQVSKYAYNNALIPDLKSRLDEVWLYYDDSIRREENDHNLVLLNHHLPELDKVFPEVPYPSVTPIHFEDLDSVLYNETRTYLDSLQKVTKYLMNAYTRRRDQVMDLEEVIAGGESAYQEIRNRYENAKLYDMVLDRASGFTLEASDRIIRKYEPIYMEPTSKVGRAQFYAPVKRIGNLTIRTLWFNIIFIWFTALVFYLTLYYDVLRKILESIENIRLRRSG